MEEKIYAAAIKLRGTTDVLDKLVESGTLDVLYDCILDIRRGEPESKSQLKVLTNLIVDEIWAQKNKKKEVEVTDEPFRSLTARSTQMLTTARSFDISRIPLSTRRATPELTSEFNQTKGTTFGKASKEPINYNIAPGPGSYNPTIYHRDKGPNVAFPKSARPEHFVKNVCQELYYPLHYVASKPRKD